MRIAIPLYDRFTALDAVGPYEVLSRLPGASVTWVAHEPGVVRTDNTMLGIEADAAFEDLPDPEIVMVPGGTGTNAFLDDERLVGWIRRAHETSQWTTSVCTGSLLLGAAGVLEGLEATSHWLDLQELERFGARPTGRRVVEQGKVVTAAGVSSGIDMALVLAAKIAGPGGGAGDPAGHRVRPPAAVRRRLRREGTGRDRRAGARRGGSARLAHADRRPCDRAVTDAVHAGPQECHAVATRARRVNSRATNWKQPPVRRSTRITCSAVRAGTCPRACDAVAWGPSSLGGPSAPGSPSWPRERSA